MHAFIHHLHNVLSHQNFIEHNCPHGNRSEWNRQGVALVLHQKEPNHIKSQTGCVAVEEYREEMDEAGGWHARDKAPHQLQPLSPFLAES